jgi:predicted nuclease of predicted toxin-antitoxin system
VPRVRVAFRRPRCASGLRIWLDAHLSPAIARWLAEILQCEVTAVRELGLRDALDRDIYLAARRASAIIMTKDSDLVALRKHLQRSLTRDSD